MILKECKLLKAAISNAKKRDDYKLINVIHVNQG